MQSYCSPRRRTHVRSSPTRRMGGGENTQPEGWPEVGGHHSATGMGFLAVDATSRRTKSPERPLGGSSFSCSQSLRDCFGVCGLAAAGGGQSQPTSLHGSYTVS